MMKAFILVYGPTLGTRAEVKACLDQLPLVTSWRYELPNCFFILSESDAKTLSDAVTECLKPPTLPRFIISEISLDMFGSLVKDSWSFIQKKDVEAKGEFGE